MAKGKLILICHSGGEFVTNDDGTMSYKGGEANAVNATSETLFNDIKLEISEACNLDQKTVTLRYFLPGNKKTLIVIKNDKDVKRMIDFHGDAFTAEVFVMGAPGFDHNVRDPQSNKKDEVAKRGRSRTKKDDKVPTSPPRKRTRSAVAEEVKRTRSAVAEEVSIDISAGSSIETSSSDGGNENADSGSASDYEPRRSASQRKRNSRSEVEIDVNVDASPADTVKKRRRTPSWKFGANGRPTIVSNPTHDSVGSKSRGKAENSGGRINSQRKSTRLSAKGNSSGETKSGGETSTVQVPDDSDEEQLDVFSGKESERGGIYDDYALPEDMVDSWKSTITGVGQEFKNVNEFRAALKKYAIANRFGYKLKKNDTIRAIGGCAVEGCTWKIKALWVPTTKSFMIKSLHNVHTCDRESRKSGHPAKNWLVGTIKDRLRESPYLRPKELVNGLLQDFGVELTYTQVWRAIGEAREQLHGSPIESYNKLPWFCEKLIETNPGSIANLVISEKKRFKSLFVCFYASIRGFENGCRPLIFLEAVSFKSRYGEILLTAITLDGNDSFFPIAFAIVDAEDDATWHWFLEQLKLSISNLQPITFVVDRDKNLKKSILAFFEDAYVGYSIHHLLTSLKRGIKGPFHGDGKGFLTVHFLAAAHAARSVGFKKSIEQIKLISSQACDWVMEIEPENYATSSFKGERYNYITQDVGESYAFIMEDYRHLPILQKIDALIRTMIVGMEDANLNASMWSTQLTALKEKELDDEKVKARGLKVLISSDTLFEVREDSTHVVDIDKWSCTCMGWIKSGLPCRHALAVFSSIGKNPYDFCSSFFTADAYRLTYAETICPIPIEAAPFQNVLFSEKEKPKKQDREGKTEDGKKETLEKTEKEEGSEENLEIVRTNIEEGEKMEVENDEGNKEGNEKEKGSNVDAEKDEGGNADTEKDEGGNLDAEKDEGGTVDAEKGDDGNVDTEKDEGGNVDAEKEEGGTVDAEKDKGIIVVVEEEVGSKLDVSKDEASYVDVEKGKGGSVDPEKDEGGNVDTEKGEGGNVDAEKGECGNVDAEKETSFIVYVRKEEGSKLDDEKDEDGKLDVEKDDPYVLVLPPIPAKQSCSNAVKKEMDSVETEGEMKRKIICKKCKQPGHYKKSCKTIV